MKKHCNSAKLTANQIHAIISMLNDGITPQKDIARHFGVSPSTITFIKNGRTYQHITGNKHVRPI